MSATLSQGTKLGSYEIVRPLGSGGMGEVYLARDARLDRDVAIKVIAPGVADHPERLRRFVKEAKTASSLNHPNIAHVYEIGDSDGLHFIVMEYVRGESLSTRIGSRGLPIADVIVYATQIADALDEAHHHGIVHRDLKPANAIISTRGKLKILDFGLAKVERDADEDGQSTMSGGTTVGMVLGTLDYMSPEQVRGLDVDRRSDIFSFGAMLYEMITGRVPFAGVSRTDTVYRITHAQPDPLSRYSYDVPPDLDRIARKCLEKEPDRRYQSVRELLIDLSNLRRDSASMPAADPMFRSSRRHHRRWWIAVAASTAALVSAGAWLMLPRPDLVGSIAVIPDRTTKADSRATALTEGLAASLINSLSQLPSLSVASRQSSFVAAAETQDPATLGNRLGVHAVLLIGVIPRGESVALSLELVDAEHDRQIWGNQYSVGLGEVELAQERISTEVAETLRLRFNPDDRRAQDVFQLYQRGRYFAGKRTDGDLRRAIEFYEQAIERDRGYARAYAGMADALNLLSTYSVAAPHDTVVRARAAASRAIELDDMLAEAHTALAWIHFRYDWNWEATEREFTRAMNLNPAYAPARHWGGLFFAAMGRFDEAMARIREAQAIDPLSTVFRAEPGWALFMARQYEQALVESRLAAEADPRSWLPLRYLGMVETQLNHFDQAIDAFRRALTMSGGTSTILKAEMGYAHAVAGHRSEAARIYYDLYTQREKNYVSPYSLAVLSTGQGNTDQAFEWLQTAIRERANLLVWANVDPRFDSLRTDQRFTDILAELKFASAAPR